MAAVKINMSKHRFSTVFFLTVIFCFLQYGMGQVVTTNDPNVTDSNTTAAPTTIPTTTTTTTTTTTVTTTTISPSGTGTDIPDSTDVSLCPCDLTGFGCDVNCCCDPDCSEADKLVFSECLDFSETFDDKLCFDRDVFFSENGPTRSGDSGSLFCIYFDNEEDRNYYNNPSLITTEDDFLQNAAKTRTFSFQSQTDPLTISNFEPYYKSGDPIFTVFENGYFNYLGLPTALASASVCADSNPSAFFIDQTTTCSRFFDNLADSCSNAGYLKALTYYNGFRVVKDPFLLQVFNSTTTTLVDPILGPVDLTGVTDIYNNSYTVQIELEPNDPLQCIINGLTGPCSFTTVPDPVYDFSQNICNDALVGVKYRFETNGVYGIDRGYVTLTFADITDSSITQTFSTTFSSVTSGSSTADQVPRSGNPGYDIGQPIIAGIFNITNDGSNTIEEILLLQERGQQLALVRPSASGDCITANGQLREPVLFGQDMRTGCFITVNDTTNCFLLQQEIIQAVEGYAVPTYDTDFSEYPKNNRYVAMFGNSDNRKTGDWVEIFYRGRPGTAALQGSDCTLSLGANIQILYANVGSLALPQPKIIGVSYIYDTPQSVQYLCTGSLCQPGQVVTNQRLEVSSSVTFIDVSDPPVGVEGQYPTVPARLPYDFFYPFTDAAPQLNRISLNLLGICLFTLFIVL